MILTADAMILTAHREVDIFVTQAFIDGITSSPAAGK